MERQILWSTGIQLFGKAFQIVTGLYAVRWITGALGQDAYGVYGKIAEFSLFFATAANLGIFGNMVRRMSEHPTDGKYLFNALVLRVGTAFAFFLAGWFTMLLFVKEGPFFWGVSFFMASLLFDNITSVCEAALQANYRMGRATAAGMAGRALELLILALLFLRHEQEIPLFFLAPLLGSALSAGLALAWANQKVKLQRLWDWAMMKMLLWTSLPFGIISLVNSAYFRFLPIWSAERILTDAQFGTYSLSLKIATLVSLFSTLFMFSVLPKLKHSLQIKDWAHAKKLYKNAQRFLVLLAVSVLGVGTWLAPTALTLMSSQNFWRPELWFILPLLLVLAAVSYFYDLALITLFAMEEDRWWLKREFGALLISGCILALSFLMPDPILRCILILTAAIAGEAAMAAWGMQKIKTILNQ